MSAWLDQMVGAVNDNVVTEKRTPRVGKDRVRTEHKVVRYELRRGAPEELRRVVGHIILNDPPGSLAELLLEDDDDPGVTVFQQFLEANLAEVPWGTVAHALCRCVVHQDAATATVLFENLASTDLGEHLTSSTPSLRRLQEVLQAHGAGWNLPVGVFPHVLQQLEEMEQAALEKYRPGHGEAFGDADLMRLQPLTTVLSEAEVDPAVAEWLVHQADVPADVLREVGEVLSGALVDWYDAAAAEWLQLRAWMASWLTLAEEPGFAGTVNGVTRDSDVYRKRIRKEVAKRNEERTARRAEAAEAAERGTLKRLVPRVLTDNTGKRVPTGEKVELGQDDPRNYVEVVFDRKAITRISRAALKAAHNGALLTFYQLRDIVLVPGTSDLHDLKTADYVRQHGKPGVLKLIRSRRIGDPGTVMYRDAHDDAAFRAALSTITNKTPIPWAGGEPDMSQAIGNLQGEKDRLFGRLGVGHDSTETSGRSRDRTPHAVTQPSEEDTSGPRLGFVLRLDDAGQPEGSADRSG